MNPYEIAGIVVGSIVVLWIIAFALWLYVVKQIMNIF